MKARFWTFSTIISLFVLLTDQISKFFIIKKLPDQPGVFIYQGKIFTLKLQYALNTKLSFSIPIPQILIIIATVIILFLLLLLINNHLKQKRLCPSLLLTTVIASAISNLFDRIYYKGVIDFISCKFFNFQWSIFNLADIYIVMAIIAYLIYEIKKNKKLTLTKNDLATDTTTGKTDQE